MPVSITLLQRFDVLRGLSDTTIKALGEQASLRQLSRREILIHGKQQHPSVYFLFDGRLQGVDFTLDGREVGLYFVDPGDFCGELCLFGETGQPESVIALSRSQVVAIPQSVFQLALTNNYNLVTQLFHRMAHRIKQLSEQRTLLGVPSVTARVCGQLWIIFSAQQSNAEDEQVIQNPPTHQELAIMLNLSRESVTRVFQKLQSQKVVKRDGSSRLLILDQEQLQTLAANSEDTD